MTDSATKIESSSNQSSAENSAANPATSLAPPGITSFFGRSTLAIKVKTPEGEQLLGDLENTPCASAKFFKITTALDSPAASRKITLIISKDNRRKVEIQDEDSQVMVSLDEKNHDELTGQICKYLSSMGETTFDNQFVSSLQRLFESYVSGCVKINLVGSGWKCEMKEQKSAQSMAELNIVQTHIIRKWRRIPYIFARKISMSRNLAHEISRGELEAKDRSHLRVFCNLIRKSVSTDLPVIFNDPRWQQQLCETEDLPKAILAAQYGLQFAAEELKMLTQLVDSTAKSGLIVLNVPARPHPFNDYNVMIIPTQEIERSLLVELEKLRGTEKPSPNAVDQQTTKGCWHPFFSLKSSAYSDAKMLGLVPTAPFPTCQVINLMPADGNREMFLTFFVASELEFAISGGKGKVLNLPAGRYTYQVEPERSNAPSLETPLNYTRKGEFVWDGRKPQVKIN